VLFEPQNKTLAGFLRSGERARISLLIVNAVEHNDGSERTERDNH
jgi:hypothetical protein